MRARLANIKIIASAWLVCSCGAQPTFEITEPGGIARVPFELVNNHIIVQAKVHGGDAVPLILDSGASASELDLALVRRVGLTLCYATESRRVDALHGDRAF